MVAWGNLFGIRVIVLMRAPHFSEAQQNWEQHSQLRERKKRNPQHILEPRSIWSHFSPRLHSFFSGFSEVNLKGSLNPNIRAGSPCIQDYYKSRLIGALLQRGAESLQLHLELRGPVCLAPWRIRLLNVPTADSTFARRIDLTRVAMYGH